MDSKTLWNRLTVLVKEFVAFDSAMSQPGASSECGTSLHEKNNFRLAIAQEITGAFIPLSKNTPAELPYYQKAIARLLMVGDFEDWLVKTLETEALSNETVYLVAKNYSTACLYAGKYETALRFWSHALTSSRDNPETTDVIPADKASEYDATPAHRKLAEEFIGFVRQNLADDGNFIDLCCGTGLNAEFLDRPNSRITGVDLELGGLKAAGRSHYFHELLEGSIESTLPTLPAAHFDGIWCCAGVYFFQDLTPCFEQASRLLKPGGIFAFNAWPAPDNGDAHITRGGTHRYCHSKAHLEKCAANTGLFLKELEWRTAYNIPNWFIAFQKAGKPE